MLHVHVAPRHKRFQNALHVLQVHEARKWALDTHSVHSVKDERCARAAFTMSRTRVNAPSAVHTQRSLCKSERCAYTAFAMNVGFVRSVHSVRVTRVNAVHAQRSQYGGRNERRRAQRSPSTAVGNLVAF
eukprot:3779942-Prymnesium_polylepis.1